MILYFGIYFVPLHHSNQDISRMDFIFIKSSKAGKEDYGSIYARVRTGKANMKVVTGFTIKQLEWEKYRSLQYTSSALMSSIGIKYGQFAQVLARIKAAFEADGFNPKEAKNIIESVKHDVLNGMMQIVEVKPKGRMLFEDFLTSYIEDMETGRRTKKGRTVKVSPAAVERDMLFDAGSLNPVLERHIDHRTCQSLEDFAFTTFPTEFKSLVTYRQNCLGGGLLRPDSDAWTFIGSNAEIVPCQVLYITDTQPREA